MPKKKFLSVCYQINYQENEDSKYRDYDFSKTMALLAKYLARQCFILRS